MLSIRNNITVCLDVDDDDRGLRGALSFALNAVMSSAVFLFLSDAVCMGLSEWLARSKPPAVRAMGVASFP